MKANIDYVNECFEITQMIGKIEKDIQKEEKEALRKMAKVVKKNIENRLSRSDIEEKAKKIQPKNYDGSRPYKHMKSDVKYSVSKDKSGEIYAKIQGGKYTGYKWHFLNDGTVKNGRIHTRATHFIDNGLEDSKTEIDQIIDQLLKGVL